MRSMPLPSACNNIFESRELRRPTQLMLDFLRTGYQHGRITRASGRFATFDLGARNGPRNLDYLFYGETPPIAEIVSNMGMLFERGKR